LGWEKGKHYNTENEKQEMIKEAWHLADIAEKHGIKIAFEYHCNTLTDSLYATALC
jgi:sugar phosphate isomerase/epimerase